MNRAYPFPWQHRSLIWQIARRDVLARYRGSLLGLGWSLLNPLLMLAVYTFVFREVFKARWGNGDGGGIEFAVQVYTGLIVFSFFSECLSRAPRLVLDQPQLVKKVVFPLEILPWTALFSALFHAAVNLCVLLAAAAVLNGELPLSIFSLPLVFLPLFPLLMGLSWFLASLGVFVRDVGQVIGMALNLLMFLSPVFYPMSALPERWQPWLALNPLTPVIEQTRGAMAGQWPDWTTLVIFTAGSVLVAWLGGWWFAVTRKGFADVL